MDVWDAVREERLDLVDRVADLSPRQWDSPSLCAQWRVRDVLGHVAAGAEGRYGLGPVVGGMIRHRFNFNRFMEADGKRRGARDPADLRRSLQEAAGHRATPPGVPSVGMLSEVVVHAQDICRPLGLERQIPESHLRAVADFLKSAGGFGTKKRIAGVRLVATDMEWVHGTGPDVTGPAEILVLFMAGRLAVVADLAGAGKAHAGRSLLVMGGQPQRWRALTSRNSSKPNGPRSRPIPDCL